MTRWQRLSHLKRPRQTSPHGPRPSHLLLTLGLLGLAGLSACAPLWGKVSAQSAPLASSLQELLPHGDRDHFVYVWERIADGERVADGIQVEHVTALEKPGEFEIALSENGVSSGRLRLRDDGHALWLLAEEDLNRGLRLSYDPPLPQIEVPLMAGTQRASGTAILSLIEDGQNVGSMRVTQTVEARAAPPVHSPLGTFSHVVSVRTARTLQGPDGAIELRDSMLLVPTIGEIASAGKASGAPELYRELACALIGLRHIGDCSNLDARVKELEHARSTDLQ